ncbi:MAG: hypothetical protein CL575_07545 [Altererythrobacter sp.]|nr:hypothetical protein [Altererythrobacter sp.]MBK62778.1 hypothetical protein [Altererythrobacter sp.]|tara:strand:- start:14847 stop:15086 length:240 start_codon:yes stop_codon:yes gene_type:complete
MLKLAIITFIAGAAAIIYARRERSIEQNAAFDKDQPHSSHKDVRDAGPQAMRDKPQREWTETDEDLDESFPASDPPGGY